MSRTRRTDLPDTNWATSALCADMPAQIFDAAGDRVQTAKAACAHCPVTRQCLRWAVSQEVEDEIRGARTPRRATTRQHSLRARVAWRRRICHGQASVHRGTDPGGCPSGIDRCPSTCHTGRCIK